MRGKKKKSSYLFTKGPLSLISKKLEGKKSKTTWAALKKKKKEGLTQ